MKSPQKTQFFFRFEVLFLRNCTYIYIYIYILYTSSFNFVFPSNEFHHGTFRIRSCEMINIKSANEFQTFNRRNMVKKMAPKTNLQHWLSLGFWWILYHTLGWSLKIPVTHRGGAVLKLLRNSEKLAETTSSILIFCGGWSGWIFFAIFWISCLSWEGHQVLISFLAWLKLEPTTKQLLAVRSL